MMRMSAKSFIDAGDRAGDYANEPVPNWGRVNPGAYGNTAQASKTIVTGTLIWIR